MESKTLCPKCGEMMDKTEKCIREHPEEAALFSLGVGFLLAQFPLRMLMAAAARLILFVLKPAALLYGIFRLAEDVYERPVRPEIHPDEPVSP